jgi:hypothetical protein
MTARRPHLRPWISRPIAVLLALQAASCTPGDAVAPRVEAVPTRPVVIAAGPTMARQGIEGLRLDLEDARSIASDATARGSIAIGATWSPSISLTEYVDYLEATMRTATGQKSAADPHLRKDEVYDPQVGGVSFIGLAGAPAPDPRVIHYGGSTTCYAFNSASIARLSSELKAIYSGVVFWSQNGWQVPDGMQSTSGIYSLSTWGDLVQATMNTKHVCDTGWWMWSKRYKTSTASRTL